MRKTKERGKRLNTKELKQEKIYTANQMTGELLLGMVLYGVISYVIYRIVYNILITFLNSEENFVLLGIIVLVLQAIMIFITFNLANKQAFKNRTIYKTDVGKVMKNISFVIIIILLTQLLGNFSNVNSTVNEVLENNSEIKYSESLFNMTHSDNEIETYKIEKDKMIQEIKSSLYQYLAIVEVGIVGIYIIAIFLEKRTITNLAK